MKINSQWSALRRLGESRLLRSSYLWLIIVPLAARLFSGIEDVVSLEIFGHSFTVHLTLPFSWKVFYFSSVSFAIASALFAYFCPKVVRDFENFSAFQESGRGKVYLESVASAYRVPLGGVVHRSVYTEKAESLASLFWHVRDHVDVAHGAVRNLAFALYVVGFLLLFIVVAQNFIFVVKYLM